MIKKKNKQAFSIFVDLPLHEKFPPRFRDEGSQCVSVAENGTAVLSAELYEIGNDIEILW